MSRPIKTIPPSMKLPLPSQQHSRNSLMIGNSKKYLLLMLRNMVMKKSKTSLSTKKNLSMIFLKKNQLKLSRKKCKFPKKSLKWKLLPLRHSQNQLLRRLPK